MTRRNVPFLFVLLVLAMPAAAADHSALKPRTQPPVPKAQDSKWIRNPIDAFILEKLHKAGLEPAPEADRATLLRRLSFDLTGLPPTPAEIAAFVNDASAGAYEKQVDRLLASPRYGERWGRHWLDVVSYAESEGFEYDRFRPGTWRYRDYVIKAFNDDKPFDRFLLEQLAGDELEASRERGEGEASRERKRPENLVAAGFHRLGPVRRNAGNKLVATSRNEVLTERTDAIGAVFLGLTMGCARCHDHRFDDISQKDYYRLQAYLASSQEHDVVLADAQAQADWKTRTDKIQNEIKSLQKTLAGKMDTSIETKIAELRRTLPKPLPTISTVKNVATERTPIYVLKRGDVDRKTTLVGPRPLDVLLPKERRNCPRTSTTHARSWRNGSTMRTILWCRACLSTASGRGTSAQASWPRRTTSASTARRRVILNCWTGWPASSWPAAGASNLCTG